MSEPSTSEIDRRKYERKIFRGTAQVQISSQQRITVRVLNISRSGIGIIAPVNLPNRATCTILFSMPSPLRGMESLEVQAAVIHRAPCKGADGFIIGLRFDNPSPRMISLIDNLVAAA
jgi:hypothetical protein